MQVGGQLLAQSSGTVWQYALPDALGSVRHLTDAAGAVQCVQSYTPFGEVLGGAGSATSSFGYTGEWEDASGLLFLRARYYDGMADAWLNALDATRRQVIPHDGKGIA